MINIIPLIIIVTLIIGCVNPLQICESDIYSSKHVDGTKICEDLINAETMNKDTNFNQYFTEMP